MPERNIGMTFAAKLGRVVQLSTAFVYSEMAMLSSFQVAKLSSFQIAEQLETALSGGHSPAQRGADLSLTDDRSSCSSPARWKGVSMFMLWVEKLQH